MKVSALFKIKGFPIVTIVIVLISFILSIMVSLLSPEWFEYLCLQTKPDYVWQYFIGIFIHNINPRWVMWVHMIMNFMGIIPLGIIMEKVIGSKSTLILFLFEWIVTATCFQVVTWNNPSQACGISSIGYAFATVGFYCIFVVLRKGNTPFYKQPILLYFLFEFLGMISMLNPMSSMTSFVLHMSGVFLGVICIFIKKEEINEKIGLMIL